MFVVSLVGLQFCSPPMHASAQSLLPHFLIQALRVHSSVRLLVVCNAVSLPLGSCSQTVNFRCTPVARSAQGWRRLVTFNYQLSSIQGGLLTFFPAGRTAVVVISPRAEACLCHALFIAIINSCNSINTDEAHVTNTFKEFPLIYNQLAELQENVGRNIVSS